mgnify:CR=1 FL=1
MGRKTRPQGGEVPAYDPSRSCAGRAPGKGSSLSARPPEVRQVCADAAERIAIDGGTLIIADDQPGDAAYLLVKGRAARLDGIGRPMEPLPIGTMVGEMAMLIETRHTATVVAVEPIKALKHV